MDLSTIHEFEEGASCHLLLFVLKGYAVSGVGFNLTPDQSSSMNPYTDKDLYLNASFRPGPGSGMAVEIHAPEDSAESWMYAVVAIVAVGVVGAWLYSRRIRKSAESSRSRPASSIEPSDSTVEKTQMSPSEMESRRKQLVQRKKELLSEVEETKAKTSDGRLSQAEADAELIRLKAESKAIRNELNRLSRRAASTGATVVSDDDDYDAILAAVARIDDDFEKGRLPKETHSKLRKEYMDKAKRILAARDAMERAGTSSGETEKAKLMEAIAALDDEHERGEISDKLYSDLRASYKKQLSELMMRSGESKEARGE